jgi:hypothetical protein
MKPVPMLESAISAIGADAHPLLRQVGYALSKKESGFNPDAVGVQTKYGRAQGMLQALPMTIESMRKKYPNLVKDPNNRTDQLMAGLLYANESLKITDKYGIPDAEKPFYAGAMHLSGHGRMDSLIKGKEFGDKYVNTNTTKYGKDVLKIINDMNSAWEAGTPVSTPKDKAVQQQVQPMSVATDQPVQTNTPIPRFGEGIDTRIGELNALLQAQNQRVIPQTYAQPVQESNYENPFWTNFKKLTGLY